MAQLKTLENPPAVIGAHSSGDPEAILNALRAGAKEFIYPPVTIESVANAIGGIAAERIARDHARQQARALGFISANGGCGATTLACHLAAGLRKLDAGRVVLLDYDLASGAAGFWLRPKNSYSVLDAVHGFSKMDESLWRGLVNTVQPDFDLLAAPTDFPLGGLPGTRGFAEVVKTARSLYDWVIVDLAQNLTTMSVAVAMELESVFVVATPDVSSLYQARRIIMKLADLGHPREFVRLVVNRVHKEDADSVRDLESVLGKAAEAVLPENRQELMAAHAAGRLISSQTELGRSIAKMTASLAGREIPEVRQTSRFSFFRTRAQQGSPGLTKPAIPSVGAKNVA